MKLTREEEWELLDECLEKGNYDKLVRQYKRLVYATLKEVLFVKALKSAFVREYSEQDIEDACQEVFAELFKDNCNNLRKYDKNKGRGLSGWIRTLAIWRANKFHREKESEQSKLSFVEDIEEFGLDRTEAVEKLLLVQKCLERLTELERSVFEFEFNKGLSSSDIADRLGRKLGNIYTIRSRAKERLKRCMDEFENNDDGMTDKNL